MPCIHLCLRAMSRVGGAIRPFIQRSESGNVVAKFAANYKPASEFAPLRTAAVIYIAVYLFGTTLSFPSLFLYVGNASPD